MHGELDILAIEAVDAEDVFVHSFATICGKSAVMCAEGRAATAG